MLTTYLPFMDHSEQKRAIAYYRSAMDIPGSLDQQKERIRMFARLSNIEILHEEEDHGQSGIASQLPGRTCLFQNWILKKDVPSFDIVLLDHVSRWGRSSQIIQECELLCAQFDKRIIYVSDALLSLRPLLYGR